MITGQVKGVESVVARFETREPKVRAALVREMQRLTIGLQSYVVANKLSGQVLKRRTGTLARSIQQRVTESNSVVAGFVGSRINDAKPLVYAAIHEYGFNGIVPVKEHLRMMVTAFGKEVKNPRKILVRAHSRHVDVPEKSYLRTSLAEMRQKIIDDLDSAVAAGIRS